MTEIQKPNPQVDSWCQTQPVSDVLLSLPERLESELHYSLPQHIADFHQERLDLTVSPRLYMP